MAESLQHKLDRVRSPRVHITYDVETGGAIEMKELPFVMGVLADLSGQPEEALPRMANRRFVEIDRDNFNEVMAGMKPRLAYRVDNELTDDGSKLGVELRFNHMNDFSPERVAEQVEPLRKLMQIRQQLSGLLAKTDGNDALSERLQEIISNTEELQQIRDEASLGETESDEASSAEEEAE